MNQLVRLSGWSLRDTLPHNIMSPCVATDLTVAGPIVRYVLHNQIVGAAQSASSPQKMASKNLSVPQFSSLAGFRVDFEAKALWIPNHANFCCPWLWRQAKLVEHRRSSCWCERLRAQNPYPHNRPLYTIDNNYHTNIISIAGSNVTPLGGQNFSIAKLENGPLPPTGTRNTIFVGISDINLWLYRYHMPDVVSIPRNIFVKQFDSVLHAITAGTHDEFNVSFRKNRRITHLCLAFVQKKGQLKTSTTDLSSGFYIGGPTLVHL